MPVNATTRLREDLPVFKLDAAPGVVFYAPGLAKRLPAAEALEVEAVIRGAAGDGQAMATAEALMEQARAAADAWQRLATSPFAPECLTLYLSNRCNLACQYCFARPPDPVVAAKRAGGSGSLSPDGRDALPILSHEAIEAAARKVAMHCATKGRHFTLVVHGGGEPTVHWDLLQWVRETVERIASEHGLGFWCYIATHGVMAEDRARWLASHFNLVGLSCDGPPDIQDRNRPTAGSKPTSTKLEQTAGLLREEGCEFVVRATVTRDTVHRQAEIVEYFCDRLLARSIRFEPAYEARHSARHFEPDQAEEFVTEFLAAREQALARGCGLELSGVRIDEIHGPFCQPLRDVLQLLPDGRAVSCFLSTGNEGDFDSAMQIGGFDAAAGLFHVEQARALEHRKRAAYIPARCAACHNVLHCARDCPDVCYLEPGGPHIEREGFRCRVQKLLGRALILELANNTP